MSKDEKKPPKEDLEALRETIRQALLGRGHMVGDPDEGSLIGNGARAGFCVDGVDVPLLIEEEREVRHSYHFYYTGKLKVRCGQLWGKNYRAALPSKTFKASKSRKENFGLDVDAIVAHVEMYVSMSKDIDQKHDAKKKSKKSWEDQLTFLKAQYAVPDWLTLTATEKGIELEGLTGVGDLEKVLKAICK